MLTRLTKEAEPPLKPMRSASRAVRQKELCDTQQMTAFRITAEPACSMRLSFSARKPLTILHVCSGRLACRRGKQVYLTGAGEALLLNGTAGTALLTPTGNFTAVALCLPEGAFSAPDPAAVLCAPDAQAPAEALLSAAEQIPEHEIRRLAAQLAAAYTAADCRSAESHVCAPSQLRMAADAFARMYAQPALHISIEQLADELQISPTHLKNSFRLIYGDSVYSYVRAQKMLAAAEKLRSSNRTVLDIAGDFGYDNGSKFAKAFQKVMGVSPRVFRRDLSLPAESVAHSRLHGPLPKDEL